MQKESLGFGFMVNSLLSDNNKKNMQRITSALLNIMITPFLRIIGDKNWWLIYHWKPQSDTKYHYLGSWYYFVVLKNMSVFYIPYIGLHCSCQFDFYIG